MPTIAQLIKKGRKPLKTKTKSPALSYYFNSIKNAPVDSASPFKRGVCIKVFTTTPKKPKLTDLPTEKVIERLLPKPIVRKLRAMARASGKLPQSKKKI